MRSGVRAYRISASASATRKRVGMSQHLRKYDKRGIAPRHFTLCVYDLLVYNFHCTGSDIVHLTAPCHLIGGFHRFGDFLRLAICWMIMSALLKNAERQTGGLGKMDTARRCWSPMLLSTNTHLASAGERSLPRGCRKIFDLSIPIDSIL